MITDNWYLVVVDNSFDLGYLVNADNPQEIKEKMPALGNNCRIDKVNWLTMKKLTGCMVPSMYKLSDFATGPLSFTTGGHVVTVIT